jgi:hypothetical protein
MTDRLHNRCQLWLIDYASGRPLAHARRPVHVACLRHLGHCERCQGTLAALQQPLADAPVLAPAPLPIDHLLGQLDGVGQEGRTADARRITRRAARWSALRPLWQYLVAVGFVAALGMLSRRRRS